MRLLRYMPFVGAMVLCFTVFTSSAQEYVEFSKTEITLEQAFNKLKDAGYNVSYGNIDLQSTLQLSGTKLTVKELLKEIQVNTDLEHRHTGNKLIFYRSKASGQTGEPQKITISGYVYDANGSESMIGVTIYDTARKAGAATNLYGFYSYSAPPPITLRYTFIGMQDTTIQFSKDVQMDVTLHASSNMLNSVEVIDSRTQRTQMSVMTLSPKEVNKLPAFMGEPDVIKSLTLMPGISSGNDNSGGFYVRGGGPDQNLVLLDGANIYNSAHAFDLFSTINADAIKQVDVIKGGFPARYGGRLSSVMDIRLREGNMEKFTGEIGLGYLLSSGTIEGPIVKDRVSFLITGRRTFIDVFNPLINAASSDKQQQLSQRITFADITAKVNAKINGRNRVFLSFYQSGDLFSVKETFRSPEENGIQFEESLDARLKWSNRVVSARWNHQFNDKLFLNTTASYSRFNIGVDFEQTQQGHAAGVDFESSVFNSFSSSIEDYGLQTLFDYYHSTKHNVKFGSQTIYHQFTPGAAFFQQSSSGSNNAVDTTFGNRVLSSVESALFIEDEIDFTARLKANIGVHASGLFVQDTFFPSLQPRVSILYSISERWKVQLSYAEMTQFVHLLTNNTLGIPLDLWVPATSDAPPMRSRQIAAGNTWSNSSRKFEFSVEAYYKRMSNLITYREGANFTKVQQPWEEKILINGTGEAYGVEFFIRKSYGKTTGWVGYTLSWTNRKFAEIHGGEYYPYKYDRRHDASIVLMHEFNKRVNVSASWIYATGNSITFPTATFQSLGQFHHLDPNYVSYGTGGELLEYEGRNSVRLPSYHRADIGLNLVKKKKRGTRTWNFSIYNLYMRKNAFLVFLSTEGGYQNTFSAFTEGRERSLRQISAFWFVPSITYNFKFN